MPSEDIKISEFNQYQKSDKSPFLKIFDFWQRIGGCKNNPEERSATKVGKHISSGFSMSTILSFKGIENNHDVYRGKDCKFFKCLKKHAMKITKKNEFISKQAAGIISKFQNLLYL